jgi:hypothetical protein
MRMKQPKEDPKIAQERERERKIAEQERAAATQQLAGDMTADFRNNVLSGRRSLFSVFR